MASPPTANQRTKSRWASSRGSTTKSASSNEEHTGCAMKSTFDSKSSPVCCQRSDASPSFWVRIHPHDFTKSHKFKQPRRLGEAIVGDAKLAANEEFRPPLTE